MAKQKYYVVWDGAEDGVFTTWEACQRAVSGYSNAKFKAFKTIEEAEEAYHLGAPLRLPPAGGESHAGCNTLHSADPVIYPELKNNSQNNRNNPTEAEELLWNYLKSDALGVRFRRQHVLDQYIVDFVCLKKKLVVEIDGGYHDTDNQKALDTQRTDVLNRLGYKVIRFKNEEVFTNITYVINKIKDELSNTHQQITNNTPQPLPPTITPHGSLPLQGGAGGGLQAIAVDAACSGNPGAMEYRGVYLLTGKEIFHYGPVYGTNNIGEFLAIVHGLALLKQKELHTMPIYSDSVNAQLWVRKKKCKTTLERNEKTEQLHQMIERAEAWLRNNTYANPIIKWKTDEWGEIPADFGRK